MMRRHRQPLEAQSAINVTNLLDTAFILLVTFMLVAPQLTHSLKVNLPQVVHAPTTPPTSPQTTVIQIAIQKKQPTDAEEHVYMKVGRTGKEERVTLDEIRTAVSNAMANAKGSAEAKVSVTIDTDRDAASGMLVKVLAVVREAGVDSIGISLAPDQPDGAAAKGKAKTKQ